MPRINVLLSSIVYPLPAPLARPRSPVEADPTSLRVQKRLGDVHSQSGFDRGQPGRHDARLGPEDAATAAFNVYDEDHDSNKCQRVQQQHLRR
jgi:hypothetical protein